MSSRLLEVYISCAFPTLFPTGAAEFVAPRQHTVTIGNYFKHLMLYEDGRFAKQGGQNIIYRQARWQTARGQTTGEKGKSREVKLLARCQQEHQQKSVHCSVLEWPGNEAMF